MDHSSVPQHNISTYANNRKAIYATDTNGDYTLVASSGWDVEGEATRQALAELERLADAAYERVVSGEISPLSFHMYNRRMDLQVLAESTGLFKWRIRRHFRPHIFARLSEKMLALYADALGISTEELGGLPEQRSLR
jgi:hypothetical protein